MIQTSLSRGFLHPHAAWQTLIFTCLVVTSSRTGCRRKLDSVMAKGFSCLITLKHDTAQHFTSAAKSRHFPLHGDKIRRARQV